jgi:sugar phosphate isomerase/epimerase
MSKARIGLSMLYMLSEPFKKMVKQLGKTPTKRIEIVDDGYHALNKKRVKSLIETGKSFDIEYSVHAPFADINIASPNKAILRVSNKRLRQSLQYAFDLDAYLWVFHPGNKSGISSFYPGVDWSQNKTSIKELDKMARDFGLPIAMENLPEKYNFLMKNHEDFTRFYDETKLDDIGIVLDTGHAYLEGQIKPFIQYLSNKIVHIHVSDNHGETDEHLGLGDGTIDWNEFAQLLKDTDFSGTLLTESVFNANDTLIKLQQLFA